MKHVKTSDQYKADIFNAYISLIYSFIHTFFSFYAIYENNEFYMMIGLLISSIYYSYATYDVYHRYEFTFEKNLSLVHHIITLYVITYYDTQLYLLNTMFLLAISSNIFLYIAYIMEKKIKGINKTKMIILFLEAFFYILNRFIFGSIVLSYYIYHRTMEFGLLVVFIIVYLFGIWWSYCMIKNVMNKYRIYLNDKHKKID